MLKKFAKIYIASILIILLAVSVYAEEVASRIEGDGDIDVTVAGNPDFYPIEYYNSWTKQFEGVMPEIFKTISERTGISFTYMYSDKLTPAQLAENLEVEAVSGYITDGGEAFAFDSATVLSYLSNGQTVNVGVAFTKKADKATVDLLKSELGKITEDEINGYFVSGEFKRPQENTTVGIVFALFFIFIIVIALLWWLRAESEKERIDLQRMTDSETGIGNLAYFEHYFSHSISSAERTKYYVAYIITDSNFVEMYRGETTFADAIKHAASAIAKQIGEGEFVARITDNGFAMAYKSKSTEKAERRIDDIIKMLNTTVGVRGTLNPVFHTAVYNLSANDRSSEFVLFNLQRNCIKLLDTNIQIKFCNSYDMNSAIEEKKLAESFAKGLAEKEFEMYLQFVVDSKTKEIVSAEALSRWVTADRGILSPGSYIETMTSAGMISQHDFYMFDMACRQLHKWHDTKFDKVSISCNFTRKTLSEETFAEKIRAIASKYIFDRKRLVIEITEDAIEKNMNNAMLNVLECKKLGFGIALDDLGSGYTSLVNLCDYPIDIVKIDRDILLKTDKKNGRELFNGMIALAHSLNLKVVCEGVENDAQSDFVTASGCDYIQGWYYSRPLSVKESENFFEEYSQID